MNHVYNLFVDTQVRIKVYWELKQNKFGITLRLIKYRSSLILKYLTFIVPALWPLIMRKMFFWGVLGHYLSFSNLM